MKLGTRGSDLAMWQAGQVRDRLLDDDPELDVELVEVQTKGDVDRSRLDVIEGRGIFVRALDLKVADGDVDAAVHSLKDVPTELIDGVELVAFLPRGPREDALVTPHGGFDDLPREAEIGTSSPRRRAQLLRARPDLTVVDLRGNVPTRVEKAHDELDGAVLARAGLERLGIAGYETLDLDRFAPAPGQGILCATARPDTEAARRLEPIGDDDAALQARIERRIIAELGVGCHTPLGVVCDVGDEVDVLAELVARDGSETVRRETTAPPGEAVEAAAELAADLREAGSHLL